MSAKKLSIQERKQNELKELFLKEQRTLIDFSDPCLRTFLPVLLQDHTTGKNIIWATDPPPELGAGFADEITLEQLDKV